LTILRTALTGPHAAGLHVRTSADSIWIMTAMGPSRCRPRRRATRQEFTWTDTPRECDVNARCHDCLQIVRSLCSSGRSTASSWRSDASIRTKSGFPIQATAGLSAGASWRATLDYSRTFAGHARNLAAALRKAVDVRGRAGNTAQRRSPSGRPRGLRQ
jgi:hypothetical protein